LDGTIEDDKKSPIQSPLKRPLNKGVVNLVENPGLIIIIYRFFPQEFVGNDEMQTLETEFEKFQKATLRFNTSLKGSLKHNKQNRTNVKVDYVDLRVDSDEMSPSDFSQFMKSVVQNEDDLQFMLQIPVLSMIGSLKSAQL
jgi:uncharacterized phage-like protein YoqJ